MHGLDPAIARHFLAIAGDPTESMAFAFLDRRGALLGARHVPSADVLAVEVPLRDVVAEALSLGAEQMVMAHIHPSGDPEPSRDDLTTTRRIAQVLGALGIRLVDHVVLTADAAVSFRARGLL